MSLEEFRNKMLITNIFTIAERNDLQEMDDLYHSGLECLREYLPEDIYKKFLQDDFQNAKDLYYGTLALGVAIQRKVLSSHIRAMPVRENVAIEALAILNENEKYVVAFSRWFAINIQRPHGSFKIYWTGTRNKYTPGFPQEELGKPIERQFQPFLKKNLWNFFIPHKKRKETIHDLVVRERKLSRKRTDLHFKICPHCKEEYIGVRSDKTTCGKDKCRKWYYREHGPIRKKREVKGSSLPEPSASP